MNFKEYRDNARFQAERYAGRIKPAAGRSINNAVRAGEWAFAVSELTSALVAEGVPVKREDADMLRRLLSGVPLPPDTPSDIAERLIITDD